MSPFGDGSWRWRLNARCELCPERRARRCKVCGALVCEFHRVKSGRYVRCLSCPSRVLAAVLRLEARWRRLEELHARLYLAAPLHCHACGQAMRPVRPGSPWHRRACRCPDSPRPSPPYPDPWEERFARPGWAGDRRG